ncbi:MAG: hypothetical protein JXB30_04650 [Anaerolineae bacterium]|nr:hypothetical protein [Anaerolineae bacterium]
MRLPKLSPLILGLVVITTLLVVPVPILAQAPAPDSYEENDTLVEASGVPATITLPNMTIVPAQDPDFWRVVANPGPLSAQVVGTPGLDLTLNLYDPSGTIIATDNDPAGPNAAVAVTVPATAYYVFEVTSTTLIEGFYELRINNVPPTPTATPTLTPTPTTPALTPTPEMGGAPDYAEPNYDFAHAYRIAVGDRLEGLNFNSGMAGAKDNDFFVMPVRAGVRYVCQTEDLGPALDTNIIVYRSADSNDWIGGSDDVDTQSEAINSQLVFVGPHDGDVYVLVGYKFPDPSDIRYPGQATYTFSCNASLPTPTPVPYVAGAGGGSVNSTPHATPLSIAMFSRPTLLPSPTSAPIGMLSITLLIGYDKNNNKEVDPNEGVVGLSVRVVNATTNTQLAHGFTDLSGGASFHVPTNNTIQVVVPFLSMARDFRPGSDANWMILIPPANAPGLIP